MAIRGDITAGSFNGSTVAIPMRDGRSLAADVFAA